MTTKPVHILLVEDDEIDAEAIQRAFLKKRILNHVTVARDGVEALQFLRGEKGHPKLPAPYIILLDLNLPKMSGLHFLKVLRADYELQSSVVFVLTTSTMAEDRADAYDLHVAGYIVKERAGDDFVRLLELLKSYWRVVEFPEV